MCCRKDYRERSFSSKAGKTVFLLSFFLKMENDFSQVKTEVKNYVTVIGLDFGEAAQISLHLLVVQREDNFIHWIGCYPPDKMCARFPR